MRHPLARFINMTHDKDVALAITHAELLLTEYSDMIFDVSQKNDFKYDSGLGMHVAQVLLLKRDIIPVFHYKPMNPFSRVIGYFQDGKQYINKRKKLSHPALVGNLIHEYSHYCGFKHGNNTRTAEKCLYSVPYYLSDNIEKWMKQL
jgi:hypothetical protein